MRRLCSFRLVLLAALGGLTSGSTQAASVFVNADIAVSESWTADNEYILTQPIYVTGGATLTIEPGTVVRGEGPSSPVANDPGTLIVSRGSKLLALGTAKRPIVFTDLFDDNVGGNTNPTPPYDTLENALGLTGQWGGVILLGRGYVANNSAGAVNAAREVQIEGLVAGPNGLYGNCAASPLAPDDCDNDDSGALSYVSIRYGGFNLSANNEINGLTLGAVGRETDLDFIEVFQNKDDGVEFFGGAAQVKHIVVASPGDDSLDYDEGWRGKAQFVFAMQGTPGTDKSDKGGEHDGGNGPDSSQPRAIPTLYNATYVGLGQKAFTNALTNTVLHFRDNAGGRYYNSLFADFGGAPILIEGGGTTSTDANSSGERSQAAYAVTAPYYPGPASAFELELQDDTWWCMGNGGTVPTGIATANGGDAGKLHHNNGLFSVAALDNTYQGCVSPLPIRDLTRLFNPDPSAPNPIGSIDPRPAAGALSTNRTPPADGFFMPADYRGAFGAINWAQDWTAMSRLGYFPPKPTVNVNADIAVSQTWSADNDYVLTQPIYVTGGATLTIEPGTVVRGEGPSSPVANDPGTLIVARGSKLLALGTAAQPIVFTDLFDDNVGGNTNPTPPYDTLENALGLTGQWGGVILLGRGYVANNTAGAVNAAREVQIEGLVAGPNGLYGNCAASPLAPDDCDNDDSGALSYVSIRYGGFNLSANNEINGLTLGAVGRETDLDFIEVFQNKDDGIEFFGGAAQLKNVMIASPGDDSLDYDEGWRGKAQFVFVMQGTPGTDKSDKGGEHDGGNGPDSSQPRAIPTLYNATYVGLGQKLFTNSLTNTVLHFRDNAGGRYYNSLFADFGGAPILIEGGGTTSTDANSSGERSQAAYVVTPPHYLGPASAFELELQDNTWWCMGNGGTVPTGIATANGGDAGKLHHNNGLFSLAALDNTYQSCVSPLPIRGLTRLINPDPSAPNPIGSIDPRRATGALTTNRTPPADGFFMSAPYRGAFGPSNWGAGWSALSCLGYFPACDVNAGSIVVPDEVAGLSVLPDRQTVSWSGATPAGLAGVQLYDLLRTRGFAALAASDFTVADCLQSDDSDTSYVDTEVPDPGEVFFYLARAVNPCGEGSLGLSSAGIERVGVDCP